MLTPEMKTLIEENTLGLVATVTPDGKPAVSPKATTVVLSPNEIAVSYTHLTLPTTPYV